jgi:hypothetical protein
VTEEAAALWGQVVAMRVALASVVSWWDKGHAGYPYDAVEAMLAREPGVNTAEADRSAMREVLRDVDKWFAKGEHGFPRELIESALGGS